jgi:hypothetical protein
LGVALAVAEGAECGRSGSSAQAAPLHKNTVSLLALGNDQADHAANYANV